MLVIATWVAEHGDMFYRQSVYKTKGFNTSLRTVGTIYIYVILNLGKGDTSIQIFLKRRLTILTRREGE